MYADRPISEELRQNKVLWGILFSKLLDFKSNFEFIIGECLSGAIRESDLISGALDVGFTRPLLVTQQPIGVSNKELEKLLGEIDLFLFRFY